jgi:hypothetical protein
VGSQEKQSPSPGIIHSLVRPECPHNRAWPRPKHACDTLVPKSKCQRTYITFFFFLVFRDRLSLYSPGCPGTQFVDQAGLELRNPPVSASRVRVLGLKACATTPCSVLLLKLHVCMYVCMHACMWHVCVCLYGMYVCMYVCMYV